MVSSSREEKLARMEAVLLENPAIGRVSLAKLAKVSPTTAQHFLATKEPYTTRAAAAGNTHPPAAPKDDSNITSEFTGNEGQISTNGLRIKTLDEALASAKVDLSVWMVDRHVVNSWEVTIKNNEGEPVPATNHQVKVWLKRKAPNPLYSGLLELTDELKLHGPRFKSVKPSKLADPHLLEISLFDHHFGKLAWAAETGSDYDIKIAADLYYQAVEGLVKKAAGFDLEQILLPLGSDFFHINSLNNMTANGTAQDVDTRLPKIFKVGCKAVIGAIEMCLQHAPVKVVWVPGNHDRETSYFLACYLEAWYHRHSNVTVDTSPTTRKYEHYGVNLLGFTHGDEEKHDTLPLIMATDNAKILSGIKHMEWHLGHYHKKKEMKHVANDTFGPVGVRVLPSLSGTDAWHYRKGYVNGQRAAEAYLWSKLHGYTGHFSVNVCP